MTTWLGLILLLQGANLGWGRGHQVIRPWAVARLPAWERDLLAPVAGNLTGDGLALQDAHASGNRPDLDPYCRIPELAVSLHDVPSNPLLAARGFGWYLDQIRLRVEAGELDESARYLGVLCHWLEDPGSPSAHCLGPVGLTEAMLRDLLPPPADRAMSAYTYGHHGLAEVGAYAIVGGEAYQPRLLGATIPEAAFRLVHGQRLVARLARGMIVPMLQDMLHGDGATADQLRGEQARVCAELVADAIHTALCLATGRLDPAEVAACGEVPLTALEVLPVRGKAAEPYVWVPFLLGQALTPQREPVPLTLTDGPVAQGLSMGVGGLAELPFPGGAYRRLTVRVGLHPSSGPGGAIFIVEGDQAELGRASAGERLAVALPESLALLRLRVVAPEGEAGHGVSAVWGDPMLHRE